MKDIYVNKEGVICACVQPVPKSPSILDCHVTEFGKPDSKSAFMLQKLAHNQALQACKESAVPFEDQELAEKILYGTYGHLDGLPMNYYQWRDEYRKKDAFYSVNANWEIVENSRYEHVYLGSARRIVEKLARLKVPAPTVATDNSGERHSIRCASYTSEGLKKRGHKPGKCDCKTVSSPVERREQEEWNLSRKKMPDFDGMYYVYGFMHHPCGNVTPFHKIVECRINQWVKSDEGEQMTYWRNLLEPPIEKSIDIE